MHLQVMVKADSMEKLVAECNLISLKGGMSYNFSPPIYDGKFYYSVYYVDVEDATIIAKVMLNERSKTTKK